MKDGDAGGEERRTERTLRPADGGGGEVSLEGMEFDSMKWKIFFLVCMLGVVLLFVYWLSDVFAPLFTGILLAYIIAPIISRLESVFRNRLLSIIFIYIYILVLVVLVPFILGSMLYNQGYSLFVTLVGEVRTDTDGNGRWDPGEAFTDLNGDGKPQPSELFIDANSNGRFDPGYIDRFLEFSERIMHDLGPRIKEWADVEVDVEQALSYVKGNIRQIAATSTKATRWLISGILSGVQGVFDVVSWLVLVPMYTFYLLYEWSDLKRSVAAYLPGRYRKRILQVVGRIDRAVSSFFRGRLLIALIKGGLISIGLFVVGVKFAFVLGMMAGFLSVIPFVGVIISAIPCMMFVVIDYNADLYRILGVLAVFSFAEAVEGFVLTPYILGKETGLHPVTLILAMLIAGKLLGMIGLLMAVPLASIVKILFEEFALPVLEELAREDGGEEEPVV